MPIVCVLNLFNLLPRLSDELVTTVALNTILETIAGDPEKICSTMKGPDGFLRFVGLENGRFAEILSRKEQCILRNERQHPSSDRTRLVERRSKHTHVLLSSDKQVERKSSKAFRILADIADQRQCTPA